MTSLDHYREALKVLQNQTPLERLESLLAYQEILEQTRQENPETLRTAYEEAVREYAS